MGKEGKNHDTPVSYTHLDVYKRQGKSVNQYLWQPIAALALSLGLCGAALNVMPGVLSLLGVLVALSAGCLLVSLEGFREEGIARCV